MDDTKKPNSMLIILGVWNLIGGILHITFEFFLLNHETVYRGFLLIENLLIGLLYLYFTFNLFFGDRQLKMFTVKINVLFWFFFVLAVLLFQPEITSLNVVKDILPLPQKHMLLVIGIIAFILSVLSCRMERIKIRV